MELLIVFFIAVFVLVQMFIGSYDRQLILVSPGTEESKKIRDSLKGLRFVRVCLVGIAVLIVIIWTLN